MSKVYLSHLSQLSQTLTQLLFESSRVVIKVIVCRIIERRDVQDLGHQSQLQHPGAMPYFFSQDPDYITVKERVARLCAFGEEATDIATIDIAIAALEVGEYLTLLMKERLSKE